jgi:hypothetical protein
MAAKTKDLAQHRATGRTYLAALSEACPPETWREIVERTVEDAKAGDYRARDWLASYLVGRPEGASVTLHQIAVEDVAGTDRVEEDATMARLLAM